MPTLKKISLRSSVYGGDSSMSEDAGEDKDKKDQQQYCLMK